jgi:pyruvate-formate lyase-activating enzyme
VPFLRDVGLVTTYRCQAACPHCIVRAGPNRSERVVVENARDWLRQAAEYRGGYIRAVALTGGEPFVDVCHLREVGSAAASVNLLVSAVTNAFWATSVEAALALLRDLTFIKIITFSTDVFHQRTIPLSRVVNAVVAAQTLGLRYIVAVCSMGDGDPAARETVRLLGDLVPPENLNVARIFPVGRASRMSDSLHFETTTTPPAAACVSAHAPVIFPNGKVVACFGPVIDIPSPHPLVLGDLEKERLAAILDRAESNVVLQIIRVWGPARLIEMIRQAGVSDLPASYVRDSVCCTCYELMRNARLAGFFQSLQKDESLAREIRYARQYYLAETGRAGREC